MSDGLVFTTIKGKDLDHLFRLGISYPSDYKVVNVYPNSFDGEINITFRAPGTPEFTRKYVESHKAENGFYVARNMDMNPAPDPSIKPTKACECGHDGLYDELDYTFHDTDCEWFSYLNFERKRMIDSGEMVFYYADNETEEVK